MALIQRRGERGGGRGVAVGVVALLIAGVLALIQPSARAAAPLLYPDLVSDSPVQSGGPEVVTIGGEDRLVMRFAGYVTNLGDGPLDITGNPQLTNPSDPTSNNVYQRVKQGDDWVNVTKPLVRYETADGHNHFHLMEITRYTMWNATKSAQVAPGQKVGFCLYDIERLANRHPDPGPLTYSGTVVRWCESGNPGATNLRMGITEGWRDIYGAGLTLQWVDISDVAPGEYWLAAESDPYGRIVESDESNNGVQFAAQKSIVAGYVAQPVGPVPVNEATTTEINLATTTYGSPEGLREFTITRGPEHGSINVPTSSPISANRLNYTPDPGFTGIDTIEFMVRQDNSPYPFNPPRATITIQVGGGTDPSVSISGAPGNLITGTSTQLTAVVANLPSGVTWTVDGVEGGNSTVGTISSSGLYESPASVPAGGVVTIRATSASQPAVYDEVNISIVPPSNQAPNVTDPGNQQSVVDAPINLGISAFDPEGGPLTFVATGMPPGLTIGLTNGVVTGTPTTAGIYSVRFDVSDGVTTTTTSITWTIAEAPSPGVNVALNQPATQVSTTADMTASRAVDGNTSGDFWSSSLSQTPRIFNPWWQVDLGESHDVDRVVLWNRTDCCATRLNNFYVMVSNQPFGSRSLNELVNDPSVAKVFHPGAAPSSLEVPLPATGRYVRVQIQGTEYLALAEVQVMTGGGGGGSSNRPPAIEPTATQTTDVGATVSLALVANDPDLDTLSWSATGLPLGLAISPATGVITGSPTETGTNAVTVQVSDGLTTAWVDFLWVVDNGLPPAGDPVNLALSRPASQSSTGGAYMASKANDGATNGDFWTGAVSHTQRDTQPWWEVDLGTSRQLDRVTVWNRTDCCTWRLADFWILVSDQPFVNADVDTLRAQPGVTAIQHIGQLAGPSATIDLDAQGRYVRIMLGTTEYLHLAEVEVYGWM